MKKYRLPLFIFLTLSLVFLLGALLTLYRSGVAKAAAAKSHLQSVAVTFYSDQGLMADGQETHLGACAALISQFPFGTEISLFGPSDLNNAKYNCTIEDTGVHICQNDIDVALPGQSAEAIQSGLQHLLLQVVGFNQTVANEAAANHPTSLGCSGGATH